MPASYKIDKEKKLVVSTAWGFCTASDVLGFREQILRDSDFDPSFSQLLDLTGVTKIDVTAQEIRMLAAMSPFSQESRRAVVAPSELAFGLARMFEILRELRGEKYIHVFRNQEEALTWLYLQDEAA